MTEPLQDLLAEDSESDAELIQRELKREGSIPGAAGETERTSSELDVPAPSVISISPCRSSAAQGAAIAREAGPPSVHFHFGQR